MENIRDWQNINMTALFDSKSRCCDVVTIVVTYNRKELLLKCVDLLLKQTAKTDVLVVDNASTDNTEDALRFSELFDNERVHYIKLNRNTGGAGGFYYGMKYAFAEGWSWFWLMDDDAEPQHNALENLIRESISQDCIYGSTAVGLFEDSGKLCFPTKKIVDEKTEFVDNYDSLAFKERVLWLPFLGFFVHRSIISKIGLPEKDLFIRNDDVEYSERARNYGAKIYMIKNSIIQHPYQPTISFVVFGKKIYYRSMLPWKMYYEVRNKIVIARRYYPFLLGIKSILGVTFQVVLSVILEKDKILYIKSFFRGVFNGIRYKLKDV